MNVTKSVCAIAILEFAGVESMNNTKHLKSHLKSTKLQPLKKQAKRGMREGEMEPERQPPKYIIPHQTTKNQQIEDPGFQTFYQQTKNEINEHEKGKRGMRKGEMKPEGQEEKRKYILAHPNPTNRFAHRDKMGAYYMEKHKNKQLHENSAEVDIKKLNDGVENFDQKGKNMLTKNLLQSQQFHPIEPKQTQQQRKTNIQVDLPPLRRHNAEANPEITKLSQTIHVPKTYKDVMEEMKHGKPDFNVDIVVNYLTESRPSEDLFGLEMNVQKLKKKKNTIHAIYRTKQAYDENEAWVILVTLIPLETKKDAVEGRVKELWFQMELDPSFYDEQLNQKPEHRTVDVWSKKIKYRQKTSGSIEFWDYGPAESLWN